MLRFKFSKLVRDKITDQQIASGAVPHFKKLSLDEHKKELVRKIIEEAKEISDASLDDVASEIADVQQAIDNLKLLYSLDNSTIKAEQARKNEKAGAFNEGIFIEYVDVAEDNSWVTYYKKNADRYPEIKL